MADAGSKIVKILLNDDYAEAVTMQAALGVTV